MTRKRRLGKPAFFALLCVFVFLCVIPAVSHAAPASALPEPTGSYEALPGTTAAVLCSFLRQSSGLMVTVLKEDGSARAAGEAVETGDRAVITDSSGAVIDCLAVSVRGSSAPSSGSSVPAPSRNSEPVLSEPASSEPVSSEPASSKPASSEPASSLPTPSSSPASAVGPVFSDSIPVESLAAVFGDEASCISVFSPDGTKRESGFVCTGDVIVLQDGNGKILRTVNVTVLGDLTRCGFATESGCSLLYGYLTGHDALPGDLLTAADMNRDGRVNTADLLQMKRKLVAAASGSGGIN